jgi:hypothetical protein
VKLREERASHIVEAEIHTCRAGSHPVLIKEVKDENDPGGLPKVRNKAAALMKLSFENPTLTW